MTEFKVGDRVELRFYTKEYRKYGEDASALATVIGYPEGPEPFGPLLEFDEEWLEFVDEHGLMARDMWSPEQCDNGFDVTLFQVVLVEPKDEPEDEAELDALLRGEFVG